jgi:hypothetical protein
VTGQKYSDAKSAISGAGLTPVVESTVGDHLAWPDCVVTRTKERTGQKYSDAKSAISGAGLTPVVESTGSVP